jgi:hypothetical protein
MVVQMLNSDEKKRPKLEDIIGDCGSNFQEKLKNSSGFNDLVILN